ncbi:MAG: hypothetical protein ACK5L6_09700 [Anaerorhabdus sp.]|uniref:hypothetical protein n=1 Tax=Anaerorhabdus sp. TaxID=1872524 RepID=UPI003A85DC81
MENQKNAYGTKELPAKLLNEVLWVFSFEKMTDAEKFSKRVQQYQKDIRMTDQQSTLKQLHS